MEFLGEIVSENDPPGISNPRWVELIGQHPNLETFPPKEGINPFTREPMLYRVRGDTARVVVGGKVVGMMSWKQDGSNLIDVYGEPWAMVPLAHHMAGSLGGRFTERRLSEL